MSGSPADAKRGAHALGRRARGRPRELDLDAVARAALDLGLEQVGVRDVAESVGVSVPGLYHHLANREELLTLAIDYAMRSFRIPEPGKAQLWPDWLAALSRTLKAALEEYPGMAEHSLNYPRVAPAIVEHEERILAILTSHYGLEERTAIRLVEGVLTFVVSHVARSQAYARADSASGRAFVEERRRLARDTAHPHAAQVFAEIELGTDDAQFEFTLELLLRGAKDLIP